MDGTELCQIEAALQAALSQVRMARNNLDKVALAAGAAAGAAATKGGLGTVEVGAAALVAAEEAEGSAAMTVKAARRAMSNDLHGRGWRYAAHRAYANAMHTLSLTNHCSSHALLTDMENGRQCEMGVMSVTQHSRRRLLRKPKANL
jgi:hypothetical protein